MDTVSVELREWGECGPEPGTALAGISLGDNVAARDTAQQLTKAGMLAIDELALGMRVRSFSYVGSVQMGRLRVTVRPKLEGAPLLNLVRYAYGLRNLKLFSQSAYATGTGTFQDLLIHQLAAETAELIARGLHRRYERLEQSLPSPRGKINFGEFLRQTGSAPATLPCVYHPRREDCLINQVLLGGLYLAAGLTQDMELRTRLRRLSSHLEASASPVRPDRETLKQLDRQSSRLTSAYDPALQLIGLLATAQGIALAPEQPSIKLRGFLFDMNRFFQALVSRFIGQNLGGYLVRDDAHLREMMHYLPGYQLRDQRPPVLRPDLLVLEGARVVAVLDTKYRDLWDRGLPPDMLYQLAMYAFSQTLGEATILYPRTEPGAQEARIEISEPSGGGVRATIVLRPVDLWRLEATISRGTDRERRKLAHALVFGAPHGADRLPAPTT